MTRRVKIYLNFATILLLAVTETTATAMPIVQAGGAVRPAFEVASIKRSSSDGRIMIRNSPGGRFSTQGTPLRLLIGNAYRVRDSQISGGPSWMSSDRWDIEAKAESGADLTPGQVQLMLQSLLADRFQLKLHSETRELPIYELMVAKNGPKLKAVPPPERPAPGAAPLAPVPGGPMPAGGFRIGRGEMEAAAVPLATLIQALSQQLGRMIVDKTGLTGTFDIKLTWTPDPGQTLGGPFGAGPVPGGPEIAPPPADPNGPSLFTALQEQLGLRLESTKGPVDVLVIDSVERPSEN